MRLVMDRVTHDRFTTYERRLDRDVREKRGERERREREALTVLLKSQVRRCVPLCLLAIKSIDVAL